MALITISVKSKLIKIKQIYRDYNTLTEEKQPIGVYQYIVAGNHKQ